MSPQNPHGVIQNPTAGTGTSAEGSQAASEALSCQSGAAACVRVWLDGTVSVHGVDGAVVMVRRLADGKQLPDSGDAQRLVPVGSLRKLADRFHLLARAQQALADGAEDDDRARAIEGIVAAFDQAGDELHRGLSSPLGEPPSRRSWRYEGTS